MYPVGDCTLSISLYLQFQMHCRYLPNGWFSRTRTFDYPTISSPQGSGDVTGDLRGCVEVGPSGSGFLLKYPSHKFYYHCFSPY